MRNYNLTLEDIEESMILDDLNENVIEEFEKLCQSDAELRNRIGNNP